VRTGVDGSAVAWGGMRIATWNVNSLKARLPAVEAWLERTEPDVLLLQETKVADDQVPGLPFRARGYDVVHHGQGRWNGVAIAARAPIGGVVTNFGDGPLAPGATADDDFDPFADARMVGADVGGVRLVSIYAPNGRTVGSAHYRGKLAWFDRLGRWLEESCDPGEPLVVAGDFNVAPADDDVWDAAAAHGGTHVSASERDALAALRHWGLLDAYRAVEPRGGRFTWWDYRAGMFHKNFGMRIDLVYVTRPVADRIVFAEIDREARKGKPTPSDHAPVVVDLDEPGLPFDGGWDAALARIAARNTETLEVASASGLNRSPSSR
jgi:exodeoxyribonuclease-3